jgi:hypothetical protein
MALLGALLLATTGFSSASASPFVHGYSADVGSLHVSIYSQMCDGYGKKLHTRLEVHNNGSSPQSLFVHDTFAKATYDPPGAIAPHKGQLVHLTSSTLTPGRTVTLTSAGQTKTLEVPPSPPGCTTSTTSSSTTTTTTKPHGGTTTTTGDPSTSTTTTVTVVPTGGGPSDPGGPVVVSPGVVTVGAKTAVPASAVKAATKASTLPFTGSDIRGFAIIGNLLVLIGFAMLLISHRSPRTAAFFQRLRPGSTA